jgi:hypothetical protein
VVGDFTWTGAASSLTAAVGVERIVEQPDIALAADKRITRLRG